MSGTPSRTATASDDGAYRRSAGGQRLRRRPPVPRGGVGRKLKANLRSEEYEVHMRHRTGGRWGVGTKSPMTFRPADVDATEMQGRLRALPWEICLTALEPGGIKEAWVSRRSHPGRRIRRTAALQNQSPCRPPGNPRLGTSQDDRRSDRSQQRPYEPHCSAAKGRTYEGELAQTIRGARSGSPRAERAQAHGVWGDGIALETRCRVTTALGIELNTPRTRRR